MFQTEEETVIKELLRLRYTLEYKQKAVRLVSSGQKVSAAAKSLGIVEQTLANWVKADKVGQLRGVKREQVSAERMGNNHLRVELAGVTMDTSEHAWLEERGPKLLPISMIAKQSPTGRPETMIDDASSRTHARFVLHDSTEESMRQLWSYVDRYGRPLRYYTDKASLFQTAFKSSQGRAKLHAATFVPGFAEQTFGSNCGSTDAWQCAFANTTWTSWLLRPPFIAPQPSKLQRKNWIFSKNGQPSLKRISILNHQ
jgi:transposase